MQARFTFVKKKKKWRNEKPGKNDASCTPPLPKTSHHLYTFLRARTIIYRQRIIYSHGTSHAGRPPSCNNNSSILTYERRFFRFAFLALRKYLWRIEHKSADRERVLYSSNWVQWVPYCAILNLSRMSLIFIKFFKINLCYFFMMSECSFYDVVMQPQIICMHRLPRFPRLI